MMFASGKSIVAAERVATTVFSGSLAGQAITTLKRCRRPFRVADSRGTELTGRALLARALALCSYLRTRHFQTDEETVGILLPPSVAAVACNLALAIDQRVGVNLNYTLSGDIIDHCNQIAGANRVLTSRLYLKRTNINLEAPVVFLEDVAEQMTGHQRAAAWLEASLLSARMLIRRLRLANVRQEDLGSDRLSIANG